MSPVLKCLCQHDVASCGVCAKPARERFRAFAARYPHATPGQLIEEAINQDQPEVVLGILWNTDIDINQPCDPQRHGSVSPLVTALRTGNARIVALIAGQPRFDLAQSLPEYDRWSWVRTASLEVLQAYLGIPGSNVNQTDGNGKTLLHEVVYDLGPQEKLRELLSRPAIVVDAEQVDQTTPLYRAGLAGNVSAFDLLLEHGADVNNRNRDNRWSILICAVAENRGAIVERLLYRRELAINAADDIGNTALHVAAERGHTRIVVLLLQRPDIQVNLENHIGWTPLAKAVFAGHSGVVRRLLGRSDVEVNFVDQHRQTPLFHAASVGNLEMVRLLLADPRTNPAISNRPAHHTAHDMATALGFTAIAALVGRHVGDKDELSPRDPYAERSVEPPGPHAPAAKAIALDRIEGMTSMRTKP